MERKLVAEWLGTFSLLATVVGSGIMAERLAGGMERRRCSARRALERATGRALGGGWARGWRGWLEPPPAPAKAAC